MTSGLLRFSSAPSSLFGEACEDSLSVRPSSLEMESLFARFLAPNPQDEINDNSSGGKRKRLFTAPPAEQRVHLSSVSSQVNYHSELPMLANEFRGVSSMSIEAERIRSSGAGANLIRQSSSPAGFFSHVNVDGGYGLMRGMAASIRGDMATDAGVPAGEFKGQINFSSRRNPLSQISEMRSEGVSGDLRNLEKNSNGPCFIPRYSVTSWEDSLLSDNLSAGVCQRTGDVTGINQIELQNEAGLAHTLSLPEIPAINKFPFYKDAVPCKIRAKRGCATHPRSIAERVRRTRISERMRKLQELFPNMDKQANTSDMLDLAVEYIKALQRQVKILSDRREACRCLARK